MMRASTALALLGAGAPVVHRVACDAEMPAQVDLHGGIPLLDRRADEHAVAHHAGVVDHDVQAAEVLERRGDDPAGAFPVGHVVAVGHRLAARRADLLDHRLRGGAVAARCRRARCQDR